jgi:hypothetical protein
MVLVNLKQLVATFVIVINVHRSRQIIEAIFSGQII